MKLKKWMWWTGAALLTAATTASVATVITSCSSETTALYKKQFLAFNPRKAATFLNDNQFSPKISGGTFDLNPETNTSSSESYKNTIKKMQLDRFQTEINQNLLQFYEAYELDTEAASGEVEAEISSIDVKNFKFIDDPTLPFGFKIELSVSVTYEVEKESNNGTTSFEKQDKTLNLIPSMVGINEIKEIKKQLTQFTPTTTAAKEAIADLREIYFGERNETETRANAIDWEDSKGVLSFLNGFINNLNPYAKMSGYTINISELKYNPVTRVGQQIVDPTQSIWAPSAVETNIYYPDINASDSIDPSFSLPTNGGLSIGNTISFAWNINELAKVTLENFKTEIGINNTIGENINVPLNTTAINKYGINLGSESNISCTKWVEQNKKIELILTNGTYTLELELDSALFAVSTTSPTQPSVPTNPTK